jgi:hypothetical protein
VTAASATTAYLPGTVVRYTPDPTRFDPRWCREGTAIADQHGRLVDTYWASMAEAHIVTDAELPSVEALFHLDDYDEIARWQHDSERWLTYHPDDRQVITSQHGLQKRWFIRKGAQPDLGTKITNAEERIREAESKLRSAEHELQWRRDELARLQARQAEEVAS